MTATIAHALPAALGWLQDSETGDNRPGIQRTQFASGQRLIRDWAGYNLAQYTIHPKILTGANDKTLLRWFLEHVGTGSIEFWGVDPLSDYHPKMLCGPLGDGTRTTYTLPVQAAADESIWVADVFQESSGYTVHSVANLCTSDNQANVVTDASGHIKTGAGAGAISLSGDHAFDGRYSILVDPTGSVGDIGAGLTSDANMPPVTVGEEYTAMVAIRGAGTFNIKIDWRTAALAFVSTSTSGAITGDDANDVVSSFTATAPATAAYAQVYCNRSTVSSDVFFLGCFGLNPGDYDTWHLPSAAPSTIEFSSAVASNARVRAGATGKRCTRLDLLSGGNMWRAVGPDYPAPSRMVAVESPEF